jgi:hypothetical protein
MESFYLSKTEDTPSIVLDPSKNIFEIAFRSLPEDANGFYEPVLKWLEMFYDNPLPKVVFVFYFEYFNTSSAKQIAKILLFLEKLSHKSEVSILWKYTKNDADMYSTGVRYSKSLSLNFEFLPV